MKNKSFCSEGKALRAFKQKILTTCIKAEPRHGNSAESLNGRCPADRGFKSKLTIMMVSVVIKEGDLRRAGRGIQEVFCSNAELGLMYCIHKEILRTPTEM